MNLQYDPCQILGNDYPLFADFSYKKVRTEGVKNNLPRMGPGLPFQKSSTVYFSWYGGALNVYLSDLEVSGMQ